MSTPVQYDFRASVSRGRSLQVLNGRELALRSDSFRAPRIHYGPIGFVRCRRSAGRQLSRPDAAASRSMKSSWRKRGRHDPGGRQRKRLWNSPFDCLYDMNLYRIVVLMVGWLVVSGREKMGTRYLLHSPINLTTGFVYDPWVYRSILQL